MRAHLRVLARPDFRNLFIARSASGIGDSMVVVALAIYVTNLTGDPTDVGIVLGAQTLTLVTFLLIGGVWADRLPRARLMIATDVVRGVLHALLAVLIFLGTVQIWELVAIELVFGAAEAFFQPAVTGLIPHTVPEADLQEAQALTQATANLNELLGPALATVLVLGVGAGWAFALDAGTFAISALFLLRMRAGSAPPPVAERGTLLGEIAEGFAHVRARKWILVTVAVFSIAVAAGYAPLFVLGPSLAKGAYDWAAMFGILTTLIGLGALIGSLVALRWRPRHPMRAGFLITAGWPALMIAFGLTAPAWIVFALGASFGAGFALFQIWWDTAMAERVPAEALSRVSSYDWLGSLVFLPVGFLLAGPLANATSTRTVMVGGGILTLVMLAIGLIPKETRNLERLERGRAGQSASPGV